MPWSTGYGDQLPAEYYRDRKIESLPLNKLMSDVWRIRYPEGTVSPYGVLASMPIPLYVTTQPWNLLAEALQAKGKDPQVESCRWKRLEDDSWWDDTTAKIDTPDWAFAVEDDPKATDQPTRPAGRRRCSTATGLPPG